jgi:hypothetical protein
MSLPVNSNTISTLKIEIKMQAAGRRPADEWGEQETLLLKRDTFHGNQESPRERHCLGYAACGWVLGEELAIDLIYNTEVISLDHEDGGLYYFTHAAACVFQDGPDILEGLPGLIFKAVANDASCVGVQAGGAGEENEFFGDDCLWKDLAHTGGLRGVEILSCFHIGV